MRPSKIFLLVVILSLFTLGCVGAASARGASPTGAAHTTRESARYLPGPPTNWAAKVRSLGFGTMAGNFVPGIIVRDGVVYVPGERTLTALDVQTGKELWTFEPDTGLALTQLAIADHTLVLKFAFTGDLIPPGGSPPDYMVGVDARTGQERWTYDETHETWISIWPGEGDAIYLVGSSGSISSLKAATGEIDWTLPRTLGAYLADLVSSGGILYLLNGGVTYSVHAIDVASKQTLWTFEAPGVDDIGLGVPSLRPTGTLLYVTGVHVLYALDEATGKIGWSYTPGPFEPGEYRPYPAIRTHPVIAGDTLYVGVALGGDTTQADCDSGPEPESYVLGLDAATGREKWRLRTEKTINTGESLVVDNGTLYFTDGALCGFSGSPNNSLYAVNIRSHSTVWRLDAGAESNLVPPLVVADGSLYAGSITFGADESSDLLYSISTSPSVGMPKAGSAGVGLWPVGLAGILCIILGVISLRIAHLST